MVFAKYPQYKSSGMSWPDVVPEHWDVLRIKRIAHISPSKTEARLELASNPTVVFLPMKCVGANGAIDTREQLNAVSVANGFTYFQRGDVIVAKITPCFENGKGACLDALPTKYGFGSTEFHVLRPRHGISSAFLYRLTTLAEFRHRGVEAMVGAAGQQRVPASFIGNYCSALPPRPEQDQIVAYLRAQDAHIARFIKVKRELIKLLTEQKLRIIDHAVTRGLDAAVALKSSGIEWLGDVPEHWDVLRIKNVVTESDERTSSGTEQLLSLSRYHGLVPFDSLSTRPPSAKDFMKYKVCRSGQLVMNRMQAWSGLFAEATSVGLISPDYSVFNVARRTSANFLSLLFKTRRYVSQFTIRSTGIGTGFNRLYTPQFGAIALALPPFEEQAEICRRITDACKPLDEAIQRAEDEIKLIREYRDRLIADVVTGQVDVRDWKPGPEDVVDDVALAALGDDTEEVTEEEDGDGEEH